MMANRSRTRSFRCLLLRHVIILLLFIARSVVSQAPGLVHTKSGYDNIDGKDPICWIAEAFHNHELVTKVLSWFNMTHTHPDNETTFDPDENGTNWKSVLQPTFFAAETEMLDECPSGTSIQMKLLHESLYGSDLYRTQHSYTYHVKATVDLQVLREAYNLTQSAFIESSDGKHSVAIRIIFCPVNGNFCSPFVVERIHQTLALDSDIEMNHDDNGGGDRRRERRILQQQNNKQEQLKELASNIFIVPVPNLNKTVIEFDVDIDIQVEEAGHYLPLASMQFFLGNDTIHGHEPGIDEDVAFKIDMANLLEQRSVHYYDPLHIQSVTEGVEIFSYVIIAVAGLVQAVLLFFTIRYRNEAVMTLSQGGFLIALQVAGLMATICSFLYNPVSDAHCILHSPLTMIPLQFMFATVFGRLLRILAIMAPLLDWHSGSTNRREMRSRLKTWKRTFMFSRSESTTTSRSSRNSESSVPSSTEGSARPHDGSRVVTSNSDRGILNRFRMKMTPIGRRRTSLRREFTRRRLCIIILIATLPMVIVEVVGLAVFQPDRTLTLNSEESAGRFECGSDQFQIYELSSTAILGITIFVDLYFAQKSRKLPALFNEVESVTSALMSTLFVSLVGFAVIIITKDPEMSPSIPYLMEVIIIVNAATNLAIRLVLPKLRLIWKGEKVVISRVLAEHRSKTQGTSSVAGSHAYASGGSYASTGIPTSTVEASRRTDVSHLDAFESTTSAVEEGHGDLGDGGSAGVASDALKGDVSDDRYDDDDDDSHEESAVAFAANIPVDDDTSSRPKKRISFTLPDMPEESTPPLPNEAHSEKPTPKKKVKPTVIVDGQAPPTKLMTAFLSHNSEMSRVGERILSGLQCSRNDWESIRDSLKDLSRLLENVEYKEAQSVTPSAERRHTTFGLRPQK